MGRYFSYSVGERKKSTNAYYSRELDISPHNGALGIIEDMYYSHADIITKLHDLASELVKKTNKLVQTISDSIDSVDSDSDSDSNNCCLYDNDSIEDIAEAISAFSQVLNNVGTSGATIFYG
jgi:hypothetical protein